MQAPPADRTVGRVDRGAHLSLVDGQPHRGVGVPARIAAGEPFDRLGERGEHGVDQAWRERRLADVPVEQQSAPQLGDLGVQQDLRPLRDDPHRLAECLDHVVGEQLAEIERAGENDRRQHRLAPVPAQITQHFESGIGRVRAAFVHRALQLARAIGDRHVGGDVDLEHDRRREVADHPVDVRVHRFAMKQRHIQQKPALRRPAADGVGEDRRQRHGRCDAALVRAGHQHLLGLRRQPVVVADGAMRLPCGRRAARWAVRGRRASRAIAVATNPGHARARRDRAGARCDSAGSCSRAPTASLP